MHKKKKSYSLPLQNPARGLGYAWDIKLFPDCHPGFPGEPGVGFLKPEADPPKNLAIDKPISKAHFSRWIKYYTDVVGYYVCVLNGLQFNLDEEMSAAGPKSTLAVMSKVLDEFADRLGIGKDYWNDYQQNPKQLVWPLSGSYCFRYHFKGSIDTVDFEYWVELDIFFECDPDALYCLNAFVKVRLTDKEHLLKTVPDWYLARLAEAAGNVVTAADPDYISSSSSYLATSSSSYP
jgi:hypothetical protein